MFGYFLKKDVFFEEGQTPERNIKGFILHINANKRSHR